MSKFINKINCLYTKLQNPNKKKITKLNIIDSFPMFTAHGLGSYSMRAKLTIQSINDTVLALSEFINKKKTDDKFKILLQNILIKKDNSNDFRLKKLFKYYGSDKSTVHNYYKIYSYLLRSIKAPRKIFEIGLGTNNPDVVSTMGTHGKPGASLRAFRDFQKSCLIYGADFDKRILFKENRIQTFFVDQTNLKTFKNLPLKIGSDFDLMIDDGLHSPNANLNSLNFFLKNIKVGGYAVIEDININTEPIWNIVSQLIKFNFISAFIKTKTACMFIAKREK
jgi:hypothetical protein